LCTGFSQDINVYISFSLRNVPFTTIYFRELSMMTVKVEAHYKDNFKI